MVLFKFRFGKYIFRGSRELCFGYDGNQFLDVYMWASSTESAEKNTNWNYGMSDLIFTVLWYIDDDLPGHLPNQDFCTPGQFPA